MSTLKSLENLNDNGASRQAKKSAATRTKLIDAAVDLIIENGFATLTTTQVAERAGLSRGAMQYHFSTRSDLLLAVIDEAWARTEVSFGGQSPESSSFEDRVDMIVDRYRVSFNDHLFPAILDIFHGSREDPVLFERVSRRFLEILDERAQRWESLFADLDLPAHQLRLAHDILRSTTRGLALRRVFGEPGHSAITKDEADMVGIIVKAILKDEL